MEKKSGSGGKNETRPACLIAAAGSGSGKTMITCGLIEALKTRGLLPVSFKCGPDYIDPMFHRIVLGIDSLNLDTFLAGTEGVRSLFLQGNGDCAVIEGVMGIYDGLSPDSDKGSSYEIARITKTPVILVVNAKGCGRTVASLVTGILADDTEKLIKGVILNNMSDAFYEKILPVLEKKIKDKRGDVKILGHIPNICDASFSGRYLGLKLPHETKDVTEKIKKVADVISEKCDIDAIIEIMREKDSSLRPEEVPQVHPLKRSLRIAVAKDEAFCFYYPENLTLLESMGAKISYFSPLNDKELPRCDAILFGGGYPELHLPALSENFSMLSSVREAIEADIPSIAECGGFMYLHSSICDTKGKIYPLVGAVDGVCTYTGHLVNFGYIRIISCENDMARGLSGMRGHEFHYYESSCPGNDMLMEKPSSQKQYRGMHVKKNGLWGWPHLYYPSAPEAVRAFLQGGQA